MAGEVRYEQRGAAAWLTLDREARRNALDLATIELLLAHLDRAEADPSVRVVCLTGAGAAFCAGVDLTTPGNVAQGATAQANPIVARSRLTDPLDRFGKPVLAAINGVAVGGGLELALACDMRIAGTTARLGLPEVRLGSLAGSGGTQRLPHMVGRALAAQMLFTGEPITAERALQAGLVSEVVAPEALMERAFALARMVADNAPLSLIAVKRALRAATEHPLGLELERQLYAALAGTQDRQEGRAAFRERRKPNFTGR